MKPLPRAVSVTQGWERAAVTLLLLSAPLWVGASHAQPGDAPPAQGLGPLRAVAMLQIPKVDAAARQSPNDPGAPFQFAAPFVVTVTPATHGQWDTTPNGQTAVWRLGITAPGAISLNLGFTRYRMPPGGRLLVYTPDYAEIIGPFTDADNEAHGALWTPLLSGDEVVVEVALPAGRVEEVALVLGSVNRGFRDIAAAVRETRNHQSCHIDVVCPEADPYRDQVRSVGLITVNGEGSCSGTLLNNTARDGKPYFFTAQHCGFGSSSAGMASSVVVYWNYESPTCGGRSRGATDQFQSGAYVRAHHDATDFALLELDDLPHLDHNVYFAGWDRSETGVTSAVGIHHPRGHVKSISFEDHAVTITSMDDTVVPGDGTALRVAKWDRGATELGSSGSPLFDQNKRVVGQLALSAAPRCIPGSEWYGRLASSWTGGGTPDSRLSDWLDPEDTGETAMDGLDSQVVVAETLRGLALRTTDAAVEVELVPAFLSPIGETLTYAALSSAPTVAPASVSESTLTVTPRAEGVSYIRVMAESPSGRRASQWFTVTVRTATEVDYDRDADGLIEVRTLVQLDAMRHDPDGDGVPVTAGAVAYASAFPGVDEVVCDSGGCAGYELDADLDFDTNGNGRSDEYDVYWNQGAGWDPVQRIQTTLEGNGHTIRHLYIDYERVERPAYGLFGRLSHSAVVRHLRLIDVEVTAKGETGGLAGRNAGLIMYSHVTGQVAGNAGVGGLVGWNEGDGRIRASYTTGSVTGLRAVGGLVGVNSGTIAASYATGLVTVAGGSTVSVGGLVGPNRGSITASYATARVTGTSSPGGLVAPSASGRIHASYWDTDTSGTSTGTNGRSTAQLREPTDYVGLYVDWNLDLDGNGTADEPWDFGTRSQYPALKVNYDGEGMATWQEFGYQLRESPTLMAKATAGQVTLSWTPVTNHWDPAPEVTYTVYRDDGSTVEAVAENLSGTLYIATAVSAGSVPIYQVAAVVSGGEAVRSASSAVAPPEITTTSPINVDENQAAVVTLTATDDDTATSELIWTIPAGGEGGADAAQFTLSRAGDLAFAMAPDHENPADADGDNVYEVTVEVSDGDNTGSLDVRIAVTDVNEAPEFSAATATRLISENTPAKQAIGPPVTATDDDNDPLTYSLDPVSETVFAIDERTGQVLTKAELDHETQPRYFVTVRVSDGKDAAGAPDLTPDATIDVTVTVTDAPGMVTLSPAPPQVGRNLTATVDDSDSPVSVSTWRWERSEDGVTWSRVAEATTATYLPRVEDSGHYLRVAVSYTDVDGADKEVTSTQTQRVSPRGGGGGGGGGDAGPACAEDLHGNTATQATDTALSAVTAGAICPAADVDYVTVTAPGRGLVFVDTIGGVPTRGTLWQDNVVLASGPTDGRGQDPRLGALVQPGPVVMALQNQGGATGAYEVVVTFIPGYLENPGEASFQSGVGVLSGWVCDADLVEIEIGALPAQVAAYGTERGDTARACGDTNNGFGLLFNWNLLRDGEHEVVALVDGVELGRARVTVTTLGEEFLRGMTGTCEAEDFPRPGERATLVWQQNSQNFVIAEGSPPADTTTGRTSALTGFLENPGHNSFQSGVRVLSGWVCDADTVELEIGTAGRQGAAYGTERLDTAGVCGDTDNGFGLLFNWNRLGEGEHEVVAFVDDVELGRATVRVTTLGHEFLRGVEGECVVEDFPSPGETVMLEWQQNSQNFVIVSHDPDGSGP